MSANIPKVACGITDNEASQNPKTFIGNLLNPKVIFLLLNIYLPIYGQDEEPKDLFDKTPPSVVERFKIQNYLEKNRGRKIGDGLPLTLLDSAFKQYFKGDWFEILVWRKLWTGMGEPDVEVKNAQYGDVIIIQPKSKNCKWEQIQMGFVRQVIDDSTVYVYEQNKSELKLTLKHLEKYHNVEVIIAPLIPRKQLAEAYKTILQEKVFVKKEKEQLKYVEKPSASDEEYKTIQTYLKKNMGRRVGDGICHTLIDSALALFFNGNIWDLMNFDGWIEREAYLNLDYANFNLGAGIVDLKDAKFGDIIIYNDAKTPWSDEGIRHIGFIKKVESDSSFYVIEQNPSPVEIHKEFVKYYIDGRIIVLRLPPKKELQRRWELVLEKKALYDAWRILNRAKEAKENKNELTIAK